MDEIVTDELIEAAFTRLHRNDLKAELAIEEELIQEEEAKVEEQSNNNQIEEVNGGDDFEWF